MKKKLFVGSIIAVAVLVFSSFPSVVGYQLEDNNLTQLKKQLESFKSNDELKNMIENFNQSNEWEPFSLIWRFIYLYCYALYTYFSTFGWFPFLLILTFYATIILFFVFPYPVPF